MYSPQNRNFHLHLVLTCSTTGEVSHAHLTLSSLPELGADLKKEIEEAYEIPSFTQTLTYGQSVEITDADNLSYALLRNGDTVWVTYTAKAECKEVERVVEYLKKLTDVFHEELPCENDSHHISQSSLYLNHAFREGITLQLRKDLFMPWKSEVKQMNKEVFIRNNGLHYLSELLRLLHTRDWNVNTYNMKILEVVILEALHPLAARFRFRKLLVKEGLVDLCMQSLFRMKLDRKETFDPNQVLPYLVVTAMGTLCNMCELHESNLKIGSNTDALEQFICIAYFTNQMSPWCAQAPLNLFACLSHTREVHPYLAAGSVVGGILDVCEYRSTLGDSTMDLFLLRYFAQLVFVQLLLWSPSLLSLAMLERIDGHMNGFLTEVDPIGLSEHEASEGCFWSVFEPFVGALYVPKTPLITVNSSLHKINELSLEEHTKQLLISKLQILSIKSALIALHMIMLNFEDGHKSLETMQSANLIPFIVAAPWHVPHSLKVQATQLVQCLGQSVHIGPPTLADLAKACLAKWHFGLERMLQLQTPYELVQEYYCV